MTSHRERLTPAECLRAMRWAGFLKGDGEPTLPEWITYDPSLVPQYHIRRGSAHDGTALFSVELIAKAFAPLLRRESYFKPMGDFDPSRELPRYTIGPLRVAAVFGTVDIPAGRFPGQRERVSLPVRCEYERVA